MLIQKAARKIWHFYWPLKVFFYHPYTWSDISAVINFQAQWLISRPERHPENSFSIEERIRGRQGTQRIQGDPQKSENKKFRLKSLLNKTKKYCQRVTITNNFSPLQRRLQSAPIYLGLSTGPGAGSSSISALAYLNQIWFHHDGCSNHFSMIHFMLKILKPMRK